ncbi:MAG: hypothetical protein ABWY06_13605 [Pseudomonas sp.]|uniref:hypothetical protein n=1 Tax=Pseudomonas sp. TaxID=306 RepID=UPI003391BC1E
MHLPRPLIASCISLSLLSPLSAWACTTEEATAKAEQVAQKIAEITQRDPDRAARLREELKAVKPETSSAQLKDECLAYDQRLRELEEAGEEVQAQSDDH